MPRSAFPPIIVAIIALLLGGCGLGGAPPGGVTGPGPGPVVIPTHRPSVSCTPYASTFSSNFTVPTTIPSGCYRVDGSLRISKNVRLTISPNTIIEFGPDSGLYVLGDLDAAGTERESILFTGTQKKPGAWNSITFAPTASSGDSRMKFVTVEFGGGGFPNSSDRLGNLWMQQSTMDAIPPRSVTITNCQFTGSSTNGVYFSANSRLKTFASNLIDKNGTVEGSNYAGIATDASEVHLLESSNIIKENKGHQFNIAESNFAPPPPPSLKVIEPLIWRSFTAPYHVEKSITINHNVSIEAGARFEFERNTSLKIQGDVAIVKMVGQVGKPIVFTGVSPEKSFWQGVTIELGHSSLSPGYGTSIELKHVTIEYGGGGRPSANLTLNNSFPSAATHNSASISDSTLRGSGNPLLPDLGGYGLYVSGPVRIDQFNKNILSGNERPARVSLHDVPELQSDIGADNDYRGNTIDEVYVVGQSTSNAADMLSGGTAGTIQWPALNVPYRLKNSLTVSDPFVLAPGTTIRFSPGTYLNARDKGLLLARGTASKPITFTNTTGTKDSTSSWKGLYFFSGGTAAAPHTLDYANIEFADDNTPEGAQTMVKVTALAESLHPYVKITNSKFRGGNGYAIYLGTIGTLTQSNNIFENMQTIYQAQ